MFAIFKKIVKNNWLNLIGRQKMTHQITRRKLMTTALTIALLLITVANLTIMAMALGILIGAKLTEGEN